MARIELARLSGHGPRRLLVFATASAAISLFFHDLISSNSLTTEVLLGYVPILLGSLSMWLCFKARARAIHKAWVLAYTILLAPFAFSYPAWLLFIWALYKSGRYHGPMP